MTLPSVDPGHQVIIFIRSWLARLPFLLSHLWPLGRTWPWGDPNMEHLLEDMWELEWSPAVASGDIIDFIYSDQICARRVPGRLDGHPNVATWSKNWRSLVAHGAFDTTHPPSKYDFQAPKMR